MPATQFGGGERLIWEARVAGVILLYSQPEYCTDQRYLQIPSGHILIEPDNEGLREFVDGAPPPPLPPSVHCAPSEIKHLCNQCSNWV